MALVRFLYFFFNDTATTEIYTLSLHDALPISGLTGDAASARSAAAGARSAMSSASSPSSSSSGSATFAFAATLAAAAGRSEEHTSELQSRQYLVCRLLLEKKK